MRTLPARTRPAAGQAADVPAATAPAAAPALAVPPAPALWEGRDILASPETSRALHAAWSGDPAIVVASPPGAGKTRLVVLLAAYLAHRAGLRVGVAAQTREQAAEIARRAGRVSTRAQLVAKSGACPPPGCTIPVVSLGQARFPAAGGGIMISTTARWLRARPWHSGCDIMIVDEAWQATFGDLGALGAFAEQVACIGDPGQIDPVVTGAVTRWQDSPRGPHLPAAAALASTYGDAVSYVTLPCTWRLGPVTTGLIQPAFYPGLPFTSRRPPEHVAAPSGADLPEIAHHAVTVTGGPADPALTAACEARARALLDGHSVVTPAGRRPLAGEDIAVVTPHVAQAAAVRARLTDVPGILTGTANQLQGLERPAVVALHPLAGYRDLRSGFGTDQGRACVMLTRHRAHLTVITDTGTPAVLAAHGPDSAAASGLLAGLLGTPAA